MLGSRILDVVAPEVGEEQERKRLEDEERQARKTTSPDHPRPHGDGTTTIRIRVPDATADRLLTYLHAWTNPRKARRQAAATTDARSECRTRPASGTRSAPCWSTSTRPSSPSTAAPPPPWS